MSDPQGLYCCPACGTVDNAILDYLAGRDELIETQRRIIEDLQEDHVRDLGVIKRLKSERNRQRTLDVRRAEVLDVLEHWRSSCHPKARELDTPTRYDAVRARLGKYSADELKRAADGYALKPYVVNGKRAPSGPKDAWRADAELVYRDPRHVDEGLRILEQADDLRSVMAVPGVAETSLSPIGEAAVRLARFGFYVFPLKPLAKTPATEHGLLNAKTDIDQIAAYWTLHPDANLGVRTGVDSGIVVLDVDGDEGWETLHRLEDRFGELPTTASVVTPGGGQHFYFQHPGFTVLNAVGYPGKSLDIRGDGGYVVAPPSMGPEGRGYEPDEQAAIAPLPVWLSTGLRKRQTRHDQSLAGGRDWAKFISEGARQGERDNRMTSYVGHMLYHDHPASEVLEAARLLNTRVVPPLPDRDLERIVGSIARTRAKADA